MMADKNPQFTLDVDVNTTVKCTLEDLLEYVEDRSDTLDDLVERFVSDQLEGADLELYGGISAWTSGSTKWSFIDKPKAKKVIERAIKKRCADWSID